jgi:hypothetical protein
MLGNTAPEHTYLHQQTLETKNLIMLSSAVSFKSTSKNNLLITKHHVDLTYVFAIKKIRTDRI